MDLSTVISLLSGNLVANLIAFSALIVAIISFFKSNSASKKVELLTNLQIHEIEQGNKPLLKVSCQKQNQNTYTITITNTSKTNAMNIIFSGNGLENHINSKEYKEKCNRRKLPAFSAIEITASKAKNSSYDSSPENYNVGLTWEDDKGTEFTESFLITLN